MDYSIVEITSSEIGHSCGYCKSSSSNYSDSIWAHTMTVQDYQDLINRGWRRSGKHCYKPIMDKTCCPLYTIKCDALDFKLTKSQKKLLKRMKNFLKEGKKKEKSECSSSNQSDDSGGSFSEIPDFVQLESQHASASSVTVEMFDTPLNTCEMRDLPSSSSHCSSKSEEKPAMPQRQLSDTSKTLSSTESHQSSSQAKKPRIGLGRDPSKPAPKKAKLIRMERRNKRLNEKGFNAQGVGSSPSKESKAKNKMENTLEDFLHEAEPEENKHHLELKLVCSCPRSSQFEETFHLELLLYQRYQVAIHNDSLKKCTERQFSNFLVESPLKAVIGEGPPCGYGSFHQQYWLDGELIAVAVLDILPLCVSSVYFFYDPDYSFLSLGTYSSLREVALVRSLQKTAPSLKYYYMGFYVHSCPKMRYKANIWPSLLLCPEIYSWHPVSDCIAKLDKSKYSRLNDDPGAVSKDSDINLREVCILWKHRVMSYAIYISKVKTREDMEEVLRYAYLVGKPCSQRILLYRA